MPRSSLVLQADPSAVNRLPDGCQPGGAPSSGLHGDAHVASGAQHGVAGSVQVSAVQIGQLDLGNLPHLQTARQKAAGSLSSR